MLVVHYTMHLIVHVHDGPEGIKGDQQLFRKGNEESRLTMKLLLKEQKQ